jgi:hypothetical protein
MDIEEVKEQLLLLLYVSLIFIFIILILLSIQVSEKFYMILFSIQLCIVFQILNPFIFLTSQIFYAMWIGKTSKNATEVIFEQAEMRMNFDIEHEFIY